MLAKSYIKYGNPDPSNRVDFLEMKAHTFADQLLLSAIINAIALKGQCRIAVEFPGGRSVRWTGTQDDVINDDIPTDQLGESPPEIYLDAIDEYYNILGSNA